MSRTLLLLALMALFAGGRVANAQDLVSPPLTLGPPEPGMLSSAVRVFVREFRFEGNTVFTDQQLAKITAPYLNHEVFSEDLEDARRAITAFYVVHGYVNSGAVLPDQDVRGGVITFRIVEGVLSEVLLSGKNRGLRDSYVKGRLEERAGTPLNINGLREGLLLLQQNPNVKQVNAELRPGATPGQSYLDVSLQEQTPYRLGLQIDNQRPPSVGADEIVMFGADNNVSGNSDALEFTYGIAHNGDDGWELTGIKDESGSYTLPVTVLDTTVTAFGSRSDNSVIQQPFANLNVDSDLVRYGVTLRQPLYRTPSQELAVSLTFERDYSKTFLLGQPFDLAPGSVNGKTDVSVLRFSQEWVDRSQQHVLAVRSTFNFGVDVFGVTVNSTNADATFFSWLGQFQYVQRILNTPNLIIFRMAGQWTDDPLVSTEQFSVGGLNTVRGYPENQLVRDTGVIASIEGRVPVLFDKTGAGILQLAPFYDFGAAWNIMASNPDPQNISSAGLGLLFSPNRHLNAELYWGYRLRHVPNPGDNALNLGLNFKVTFEAF